MKKGFKTRVERWQLGSLGGGGERERERDDEWGSKVGRCIGGCRCGSTYIHMYIHPLCLSSVGIHMWVGGWVDQGEDIRISRSSWSWTPIPIGIQAKRPVCRVIRNPTLIVHIPIKIRNLDSHRLRRLGSSRAVDPSLRYL